MTHSTSLHGLTVLDIGCGTGGVAISSAAMGGYVVALDPDIRRLSVARVWAKALSNEVNLVRASALHLPFIQSAFKIIFLIDILEHVKNQIRAIEETVRALSPEGRILIKMGNRLFPYEPHLKMFFASYFPNCLVNAIAVRRKIFSVYYSSYSDIHLLTYPQLNSLLRTANLEYTAYPYMAFFPGAPYKEIPLAIKLPRFLHRLLLWFDNWIIVCKIRKREIIPHKINCAKRPYAVWVM
mgnify:CR=1 FL=1